MNKKISIFIISILFLSCFIGIINLNSVNAELVYIANNNLSYATGYGEFFGDTHKNVSQTFEAQNTAYLDTVTITVRAQSTPTAYFKASMFNTTNYAPDYNKLIEESTSVFGFTGTNGGYISMTFDFSNTIQLHDGLYYAVVVTAVYTDYTYGSKYFYWAVSSGGGSGGVTGGQYWGNMVSFTESNPWGYGGTNFFVFGQTELPIEPTAPPPEIPDGTVNVNYFINPSIENANFTVCIPPTTNYVTVDSLTTWYFNDGTTLLFLPQLANGWYFNHYNLTTNTGYNVSYQINNWAIMLDSSLGSQWNFTLYVSQTANTVDLRLIDVTHGSIYFQNYVDSVPSGTRYGAGTYNITYATVLYISTLPDTGYITDYFTVVSNGITSQVTGSYLTFIASSNTTITPHYSVSSSTGVTGGLGGILGFLGGFTWQNIAILIIYAVICGLCTYAFAFTGLIAGLDISTIICFVTGLLGNLMYPVLGLCIVANIALIVTGSGLLNRKKNGTDA